MIKKPSYKNVGGAILERQQIFLGLKARHTNL